MPKSLFISNVMPWPLDTGAKIRVYHMLRAVAAESDVTLLSFTNDDDNAPAQIYELVNEVHTVSRQTCRYTRHSRLPALPRRITALSGLLALPTPELVRYWRSDEAATLVRTLSKHPFDLIWGEHLGSVNLIGAFAHAPRIIDLFDLEHRKLGHWIAAADKSIRHPIQYLEFLKLRRFEREVASRYQVLVCSDIDKQALGNDAAVSVVPNGIDLAPTAVMNCAGPDTRFLFVGTLDYAPNTDAILFFCEQVLPRIQKVLPHAIVDIVGRNPTSQIRALHDGTHVVVSPNVPTIVPYLRQATALVAPIRFGGGTRIKILEALSHGVPVVSSAVGAEGIDVKAERDILIADDPAAFASSCIRLASDRALRRRLRWNGRDLIAQRYQWSNIEEQVRNIVRSRVN